MTPQDIACIVMLILIVAWGVYSMRRIMRQVPKRKPPKRTTRRGNIPTRRTT